MAFSAFAIFDRATRQLAVLVRDHLGVKPLFYVLDAEEIRFASEPLALFGAHHPVPDSEPEDLDAYFTFNYLPAPRTGLKGSANYHRELVAVLVQKDPTSPLLED